MYKVESLKREIDGQKLKKPGYQKNQRSKNGFKNRNIYEQSIYIYKHFFDFITC